MNELHLLKLFKQVAEGSLSPEKAVEKAGFVPYAELAEGVTLDTSRCARTGQPEVVFGNGKSDAQLTAAVRGLADCDQPALVTKLDARQGEVLSAAFPEGSFYEPPGLFALGKDISLNAPYPASGEVMVVSAGSSDAPIALEALGTALFFGLDCGFLPDVGVAGLHRLLPHVETLSAAKLHVVVAGMEGALPSVLSGMFGKPVIAVPTSVGYGTGLGGISALLSMLNSCAPGLAVVNIDNGFGAGSLAAKLIRELS